MRKGHISRQVLSVRAARSEGGTRGSRIHCTGARVPLAGGTADAAATTTSHNKLQPVLAVSRFLQPRENSCLRITAGYRPKPFSIMNQPNAALPASFSGQYRKDKNQHHRNRSGDVPNSLTETSRKGNAHSPSHGRGGGGRRATHEGHGPSRSHHGPCCQRSLQHHWVISGRRLAGRGGYAINRQTTSSVATPWRHPGTPSSDVSSLSPADLRYYYSWATAVAVVFNVLFVSGAECGTVKIAHVWQRNISPTTLRSQGKTVLQYNRLESHVAGASSRAARCEKSTQRQAHHCTHGNYTLYAGKLTRAYEPDSLASTCPGGRSATLANDGTTVQASEARERSQRCTTTLVQDTCSKTSPPP